MRKIGFIGAYDKIDFVIYIAKILVQMGQRVLVIDGTITQKSRYIVPSIQPTTTYVTEFEGIDIAVGLKSFVDIKDYLGIPQINELPYDIVLIDTDMAQRVEDYEMETCEKMYFVTSFDMYSIKRGIESISRIQTTVNATKVLFSRNANKAENEYLNYLSSESNIQWNDEIIYMPFELGDQTVIYKNQRVSKIKIRGLTNQYKEGLLYITNQIMGEQNFQTLRKVFKKVEKGV